MSNYQSHFQSHFQSPHFTGSSPRNAMWGRLARAAIFSASLPCKKFVFAALTCPNQFMQQYHHHNSCSWGWHSSWEGVSLHAWVQ